MTAAAVRDRSPRGSGGPAPAHAHAQSALLIDFGGVLTSSVAASFAAYEAAAGLPVGSIGRLLSEDGEAALLLVDHECGRLSDEDFEDGLAARADTRGVTVTSRGLLAALQAGLQPDDAILEQLRLLRAAGVPTAIVSNALGRGCYAGYDLPSLVDHVILSSDLGVRKPSRRIYAAAAERLGVEPAECVLVDDLQQNLDGAARLGVVGILHTTAAATVAALDALDLPAAALARPQ